jgi:hypothetical protein
MGLLCCWVQDERKGHIIPGNAGTANIGTFVGEITLAKGEFVGNSERGAVVFVQGSDQ